MPDVVIVGSGASGVAAALALSDLGVRPVMLDVGFQPPVTPRVDGNFYEHRRQVDTFELVLGARYQGLSNMLGGREVPVKLTAPFSEFVTHRWAEMSPLNETGFCAIQSFARGGLANAWGSGLYRFVSDDLHGFPFGIEDLDRHFDRLTEEIGITGNDDDLAPYFGPTRGLIDPLPLSRNLSDFYRRYQRRTKSRRIRIGRARVGVLTREHNGRPAYRHRSLEFFEEDRSIYSPRYTLDRLEAEERVEVRSGLIVESFREDSNCVTVNAKQVSSGKRTEVSADVVLLAAGAINTSRIVLASAQDHQTQLPLLENPAFQIPLVMPHALGRRLDEEAFGLVQLNLVWDCEVHDARLQGSIMEITAPARAEFFAGFPYSARANLSLIRYMLPGMIVMQLFFPGESQPPSRVSLQPDGALRIEGQPNSIDVRTLAPLLRFLRRLGAMTAVRLIVRVPTGHAVHYAGTLPMRESPGRYECHPSGRLAGTRSVYIADSAGFPRLQSKNMSFGMMANAMRVAGISVEETR